MLRRPEAGREGGAAGGGAAGGSAVGCDAAGADAGSGGIEAPEGGAEAGVDPGVAVHAPGAAGIGVVGGVSREGRGRHRCRGRRHRGGRGRHRCRGRRHHGRGHEADRRDDAPRLHLPLQRDRLACRGRHLARGRIAIGGVLGRRLGDDVVEGGHELGARRAGLRRRVADVRPELGDVAVLRVGDLAGQHLVEDAAQRVDVGATVDRVALDLLGGDVVGGPHPQAGPRQASGRPRALGQPEVGEVGVGVRASRRRSGCWPA